MHIIYSNKQLKRLKKILEKDIYINLRIVTNLQLKYVIAF